MNLDEKISNLERRLKANALEWYNNATPLEFYIMSIDNPGYINWILTEVISK